MLEKFKETFREEAEELLAQLESILLELEAAPTDQELINAAFRAVHTVKGSAGMFGFERVGRFTHDLESLLDACRNGKRLVDKGIVDLTLKARDKIRSMLAEDDGTAPFDDEAIALMDEFRKQADLTRAGAAAALPPAAPQAAILSPPPAGAEPGAGRPPVSAPATTAPVAAPKAPSAAPASRSSAAVYDVPADELATYRLRWRPAADVFLNGTRVLKLFGELASLGDVTAIPSVHDIPPLESVSAEACYVSWDAVVTTNRGINAIRDVFIFVEDSPELLVERIEALPPGHAVRKLGEILLERGVVAPEPLGEALKTQRKLGEVLVERNLVTGDQLASALAEQTHLKRVQERQAEAGTASIRVASEKLDQLVDLVGEMVTLQARLSRTAVGLAEPELSSIAEQLERLVSQLRDNAMSVRMLPIGSTFNKFRRVVRDLSAELGKDVELMAEGAETELDKTVIERLNDPLVHIIRNALDHGIEKPAARTAAGKPARGTVRLSASHSGANVVIQVSDDGAGMDLDAIRAKAVERGIISRDEVLSEAEAYGLVFRPGFSTAKVVTSVSGRGVGMDVVKREIEALGGVVAVESRRGQGSSISLKIPLTLAIIEGLLVRISSEHYVLPLSSVEACLELTAEEAASGDRLLRYRGELLPWLDLRAFFAVPGEPPATRQVVVVTTQDMRLGLVVDSVVGDYQTVIKPLGRMFKDASGLSGATILGDGTVALIVDFNRLASAAFPERGQRTRTA